MAIGCAANCAKITLFIVNIVFLLSGLLVIAIGIWLTADDSVLKLVRFIVPEHTVLFRAAAGLLIAMGIVVLIVTVLGFIGAYQENPILLGIYTGLLAVIFCGEVAAGIIAIVYQDKIINKVTSSMSVSLNSAMNSLQSPYYSRINNNTNDCAASDTGTSWDYVQVYFSCCGVGSYDLSGYENAQVYLPSICPSLNLKTNKPLTCCSHYSGFSASDMKLKNQTAYLDRFNCNQIVSVGCADAMIAWIQKYAPVLIGIGIGIGMLEMVIIIFALCLCQHREKDQF